MITINRTILVEGNYDKIKLSSLVDAHIVATGGFRIFRDKAMQKMISDLAKAQGLIILTDSDRAGFAIRGFIKGFVKEGDIINLYIPDVPGKEKRKKTPGKEGLLGVEGMEDDVLIDLLKKADVPRVKRDSVSYYEYYADGFAGGLGSNKKRETFCQLANLPRRLSAKELLSVINRLYTPEEYRALRERVLGEEKRAGHPTGTNGAEK